MGSPLLDSYPARLHFGGSAEASKGGGCLIPPGLGLDTAEAYTPPWAERDIFQILGYI